MPNFTAPTLGLNRTLEGLVAYEVSQVSYVGPGILFLIFMCIFLAGAYSSKRSSDKSSVISWLFLSSFVTSVIGFILFLASGILTLEVMTISVCLTLLFGLMFFLVRIAED